MRRQLWPSLGGTETVWRAPESEPADSTSFPFRVWSTSGTKLTLPTESAVWRNELTCSVPFLSKSQANIKDSSETKHQIKERKVAKTIIIIQVSLPYKYLWKLIDIGI